MLHLILGRAGTGKSTYIINSFCKSAGRDSRSLLLVPEQFTVTAEKAVTEKIGGFWGNTEVLNFKRLCNKIFTLCGGLSASYADEGGKAVIMSAALESVKDSLKAYEKAPVSSADFISRLLAAANELKTYKVSADTLNEKALLIKNEQQRQKIQELSLILKTYDCLLKKSFDDMSEDMDKAALLLKENRVLEGYSVYLDSYKGFTPQEYALIAEILKQADEVYISLTCDGIIDEEGGYGLFSPVKATAVRLKRMADRLHIKQAEDIILSECKRFNNDELRHLEKELFNIKPAVYDKQTEYITLMSCKDLFSEAELCARQICRLVREKGFRYRDFVIITRSLEDYKGIIDTVFESYDIPVFMDKRTGLAHKPLILFVMNALNIINYGFTTEYIFNYLKTGLLDYSTADICALESYCVMWRISGARFTDKKPWRYNPDGFSRDLTPEGQELIEKFNRLRNGIIKPLNRLKADLKDGTVKEKCAAVYNFLTALNIPAKLEMQALEFKKDGELALSLEQEQIWDIFIKGLDQMAAAGGDFYADTEQFAKLLELVLSGCDIGTIPTSKDEVLAGSADRIRSMKPKCVFVLGLNDGIFPMIYKDSGIISDMDRRVLSDLDIELAPTTEDKSFEEPYFAYTAFNLSSEYLFLSYHKTGQDGKEARPSGIIADIKHIFKNAAVINDDTANKIDYIERKKPSFEFLMSRSDRDAFLEGLKNYFGKDKEYSVKLKAAEALRDFGRNDRIADKDISGRLFGERLYISPTRLESYYSCGFKHFCEYGLRLRPEKKAQLDAAQTGTFIHHALETIIREAAKNGKELWQYKPEELKAKAEELSASYLNDYLGGAEEKTARFKFLFNRLRATVETLLASLAAEFKENGFVMTDFELKIGKGMDIEPVSIPVDGGGTVEVYGTADRVDTFKKDGAVYIRIVDYKTGIKQFKLSDVLNGLNLQMLIYLFTVWQNGKERYGGDITPAGILYFPARDPILPLARHTSAEDIEAQRQQRLKQNGLLLADFDILDRMEKGLLGRYIPVGLNKNGTFKAGSQLATLEQFGKLKRYAERLLSELGSELKKGSISINPIKDTQYNSCHYCDMLPVCGYEPGRSRKRAYKKCKSKEFFDKI